MGTEENNENSKSQSSDDTQGSGADVEVEKSNELVLDFLPEKPLPVDGDSSSLLLGMDPSLESLGLASWWPSGRVQYFMEFLHSTSGLDLEWWQAIIVTTVIFRVIAFPLVVMAQKNVSHLNNHMPKMQQLQAKMTDARQRGDVYESAVLGGELQTFMKEKKVNPTKNVIPLFLQFPLFASMFIGLRGMANLPLESMMSGGLFWFHDLTIPDPYYLLPLFTSVSLYMQIHIGADGMSTQNFGPIGKTVMKAMPVLLFLFTMNFPAAIGFYWCTTNVISVAQAKVIRIESLRRILGIPKFIKWDEQKLPVKQKGVRGAFRVKSRIVEQSMQLHFVTLELESQRKHSSTILPNLELAYDKMSTRKSVIYLYTDFGSAYIDQLKTHFSKVFSNFSSTLCINDGDFRPII